MRITSMIIILSILSYLSCTKKKNEVELLTNGQHKFWDFKFPQNIKGAFYFDSDNNFFLYHYSALDGSRYKYSFGDVLVSNKWEFIETDTLIMNNEKYKLVNLTDDSLVVIRIGNIMDTFNCVKSSIQTK